jgi:hypothetical protein
MSTEKGGLFIAFENSRREVLLTSVEEVGRFSVELSASDWRVDKKEMYLLSLRERRDHIDFAAIGRRKGGPRNTGAHNIEFTDFVPINFSLADLLDKLPEPARALVKAREGRRGKWFPPTSWSALLNLIRRRRPGIGPQLDALWAKVTAVDDSRGEGHVEKLGLQRDAIGLSLDIAGMTSIRRKTFRKIGPISPEDDADSFIALMDDASPQERELVDHDRSLLAGIVARGEYETTGFTDGPRSLRVWTVDKGPIERFAGIDLVILNKDFNSLLLVQYKCLEQEGTRGARPWRYRPNPMFDDEVGRMKEVHRIILNRRQPAPLGERLDCEALYFKFCKRVPLSKQDGELADGMFVSFPSTMEFLNSPEAQGPKGGSYIGYENFERYLNNSLFCALARDGWIGAYGLNSRGYEEALGLLRERDQSSLVFAETETTLPAGAPKVRRRSGWR